MQRFGGGAASGWAASVLLAVVWSAAAAAADRTRPYSLDDYFAREEIVAAHVDPTGRFIAVEVQRPQLRDENYIAPSSSDEFSRRSDLLLLDATTGATLWKTDGRTERESFVHARWSADGKQLGLLRSRPNSPLLLAVLNVDELGLRTFADVDVDFRVPFTRDSSAANEAKLHRGAFDPSSAYAWSADGRIFVASRGSLPGQPLGEAMNAELDQRRRLTWRGDRSSRVWDSVRPALCNKGVTLLEISRTGSKIRKLYTGDMVGVSLSPDGRRIAVVTAESVAAPTSPAPLRMTAQVRISNKNDFLHWQVSVLDQADGYKQVRRRVDGFGAVAPSLLPRWSRQGDRLAVVSAGNSGMAEDMPAVALLDLRHGSVVTKSAQTVDAAQALSEGYVAPRGFAVRDGSAGPERRPGRENVSVSGVTKDGSLIYHGDTDEGTFLWARDRQGREGRLLQKNLETATLIVPEHRLIHYRVDDTERVGVLLLPTVSKFGARPPVIVTAYPMPQPLTENWLEPLTSVSHDVTPLFHPYLSAGFAVFVADMRSPAGADDPRDTAEVVVSEILPAVDALKIETTVDASNLGFTGLSHGGYTALTLLNRTQRFKAIVAKVALANLSLNLNAIPEIQFDDCAPNFGLLAFQELEDPDEGFIRVGTPLYRNTRRLVADSPVFNMEHAVTPTLLISGEFDWYAPDAEQVYMTLLRKGVDAKLIQYWGENHVIAGPGNVRDSIEQQIAWFARYLLPESHIN